MAINIKAVPLFFVAASVAAVCVCITSSAWARHGANQKLATHFREMLEVTRRADQQLFQQVDVVADKLAEYMQEQDHFPDPGEDLDKLAGNISLVLPDNPYSPNIVKTNIDGSEETERPSRVKLIFDPSIDARVLEAYKLQPPASWTAAPGTIVALSNGYDLCVLWAAGSDTRPVREPSSSKIFILSLKRAD